MLEIGHSMRSLALAGSLLALLASLSSTSCNRKTAEPEEEKGARKSAPEREAIRRGPTHGTIGKPLCDASMRDMQAAIKAAGWSPAGYTESTSGGTTTRSFPSQHGRLTGAVTWYRTNDKDMIHATVVQGWPSAEDGECILAVRTTDDGKRDEAKRLLTSLVGP